MTDNFSSASALHDSLNTKYLLQGFSQPFTTMWLGAALIFSNQEQYRSELSNCVLDPFRWKMKKWANVQLTIVLHCTMYVLGGGGHGPQQSLIRQVITGTLCRAGSKMNGRGVAKSSNCQFVCCGAPLTQHLHDINITFHPHCSHHLCLLPSLSLS